MLSRVCIQHNGSDMYKIHMKARSLVRADEDRRAAA
jgi:hypothetical protein